MAVIQTLRNKMGKLLVAVLAIAILGFIFMDMQGQGGQGQTQQRQDAGEIAGETITEQMLVNKANELASKDFVYQRRSPNFQYSRDQIYDFKVDAWNTLVQEKILQSQYNELGIELSDEEQRFLISGNNPHPEIQRIYVKEPGAAFDPVWFQSYLQQLQSAQPQNEEQSYRIQQERNTLNFLTQDIFSTERFGKYETLLSNGNYVPSWAVHEEFAERNTKATAQYLLVPFDHMKDQEVEVSDEDIRAYYEEVKSKYKVVDDSRAVDYVVFNVIPSKEDSAAVYTQVQDLLIGFKEGDEDSTYATTYSSLDAPYKPGFQTSENISAAAQTSLFGKEPGSTSEIYLEEGYYKVSKLMAQDRISDSIQWRHIFIGSTGERSIDSCELIADSIMDALKGGADFAALAQQYSDDQGSAEKGGEMDWMNYENQFFNKSQNNRIFTTNQGETFKWKTNNATAYGVQIINIQRAARNVPALKMATLSVAIEAGSQTISVQEQKAQEFTQSFARKDKFDSGVVAMGLNKRVAESILPVDKHISGLRDVRTLVTWAYTSEVGETKYFDFQGEHDKFVVAKIVAANNQGEYQDFERVKESLRAETLKKKKAQKIMDELNNAGTTDLQELAKRLGLVVEEARNIILGSNAFGSEGEEPRVVGAVFGIAENTVSKPFEGGGGVYMVKRIQLTPAPEAQDKEIAREKQRLMQMVVPNSQMILGELVKMLGSKNQTFQLF